MSKNHLHQHSQKIQLSSTQPIQYATLCLANASLSDLKQELFSFLHPEEIRYFNTISSSKRQQSYLLGRYAAKNAFYSYSPTFIPPQVLIKPGIFEQPIIYFTDPHNLKVTLSHTDYKAAALVFPEAYPMGIDIEFIKPNIQEIIENLLTDNEKKWITSHLSIEYPILYSILWTIKEALSKAIHTGMMTPFEIYGIKNIITHHPYWSAEFDNFGQYQSKSFLIGNHICSIVYPKQIELNIDIVTIQRSSLF